MNPSGPTSHGIGKNLDGFNGSIGGCNMDFSQTADRGYAYKQDDARDLEIKMLIKIDGTGSNGFSISACTGRHTGSQCCQGFAYMLTTEVADNPSKFNFRKEMWHVSYHSSPIGLFSHPKCNFRIRDAGKYVGLCFCRYNDPNDINDAVVVEVWFNPDPDADLNDWSMLKRFVDHNGAGWGNDGDDCGGARDQAGTWSNVNNRLKTNASGGTVKIKNLTLREIDPSKTFGEEPGPGPGPSPEPEPQPVSYTFDFKFGSQGTGDGRFQDPHDVSFDSTGNVFVPDRVRNDIQKFTAAGVFVSKFGGPGSGNGQFNVPYSVAHDSSNNIYVADRDNNRVQKLNSSGTYISQITSAGGRNLKGPEDIAFDFATGNFYVTDTDNERIVKFNSSHTFLLEWGSKGSGNGQFDHPHSIDVDTAGNVYVSSGNQPYVQKFTSTGTFVKKWGSEGNGQGQTRMFLEHMDVDHLNRVHLINNDVRPIINVWDTDGNWITQYGKTTKGSADGQFSEPEHVTCDSTGRPYVVDSGNHRIQVFKLSGSSGGGGTTNPPPTPQPPPSGGVTKVTGTFTLLRDINQFRTSACQGSGGGGGSGGSSRFYIVPADNDKQLSDTTGWDYRTRIGAKLKKSTHPMKGKILKQLDVPLKKVGTPAASPTVTAVIWDSNNNPIYTSPTTIDPTTLTTSFVSKSFDFSTNTHEFVLGDIVGIRYYADSPTSDANYVVGGYESTSTAGGVVMFQMEAGVGEEKPTRDFACDMWD